MEGSKGRGHVSFAQKIAQAWEDEVVSKRVKRKKVKESQEGSLGAQLEFLRECRMMYMLEWNHSMLQMLVYELIYPTILANPFDLMLLYEEGEKEKEVYNRNELRIDQGFGVMVGGLKKIKEHVGHVLRMRKHRETRNVAMDKAIRSFMMRIGMNTINWLYRENDSEIMRFFDFIFMEPLMLRENYMCFSDFAIDYKSEQNRPLMDLFLLRRGDEP